MTHNRLIFYTDLFFWLHAQFTIRCAYNNTDLPSGICSKSRKQKQTKCDLKYVFSLVHIILNFAKLTDVNYEHNYVKI